MTLGRLILLFTVVPVVELVLLIEIGSLVGTLYTVALILGTGALGAALARAQGLRVLREVQAEFGQGRLPAASLIDGLLILLAGALLLTPGVLTDALGFACLTPFFRKQIRRLLRVRFEAAVRDGRLELHGLGGPDLRVGEVYDAEFDPAPDPGSERPEREGSARAPRR